MAEGDPIGADLVSGTTNANTLPSWLGAYEEREITFGAGTELISGTKYAIVVRAVDADDFESVYWRAGGNDLANGRAKYSENSGSAWINDGDTDMWFKTKSATVEKDTNEPGGASNGYDIYNVNWNAQTFTASSTYTITSVVLKLAIWPGLTPGTLTVSIKAISVPTSKAITPAPTNIATDVTLDQATISWVDGGDSDTFDVYYGDTSGSLSPVSSAQAGLSFTVTGVTLGSPYEYIITRYWRIDSTNDAGTITGDEWSFTTIRFVPPGVTHWHSTTNTYYRLLVQSDGTYGDHIADGGVENTDYVVVTYEPNFIRTNRVLVAIAENRFWYEEIV